MTQGTGVTLVNMEDEKMVGGNIMSIEDKVKLVNFIREVRHLACDAGVYELRDETKKHFLCQSKEAKFVHEYKFFKGLSRQSDIDDVISLSKIVSRLNLVAPKVKLDFNNIDETFDKIWKGLNDQVPISDEIREWATKLANDIMENINDYPKNIRFYLMLECMGFLHENYKDYLYLTREDTYRIKVPYRFVDGEQIYFTQFVVL